MTDRVKRLRNSREWLNNGECCGDTDSVGTCAAPACIFGEAIKELQLAADRIEKLEAALREIAKTFTIVDENWHPSYHDFSFTQKQAEGAYKELGCRIQIARKALEERNV